VYTVDGFLSFTVNQPFNAWRNRNLTQGGQEQWKRIDFSYPGDSSFTLTKDSTGWSVDGVPCDAKAAGDYTTAIANLNSSAFLDDYQPGANQAVYRVRIRGDNNNDITLEAYPADTTVTLALHSSLNPDAWFSEKGSHIADRLFVSKGKFFPAQGE
jgi:hypothetical protein